MSSTPKSSPTPEEKPAAEHVAEAHRLLTSLRGELDQHASLEEAIRRLEMALTILGVKTGAML